LKKLFGEWSTGVVLSVLVASPCFAQAVDANKWVKTIETSTNLNHGEKAIMISSMEEKGVGKVMFLGAYPPLHPLACITGSQKTNTDECVNVPGLSGRWHLRDCTIACAAANVAYWCEDADACL
jgi:hypothetical protein